MRSRRSLLTPTLPPEEGRSRKRERDKLNTRSITNTINNEINKTKYTKPTLSFPELDAGHWRPTSSCQAAPGSPGMASAADGNWAQGHTDQDLDQDHRQDNEQGPLQKAAIDKVSETLVVPQL